MRFREVALIALWTLLIGPVLARPVADDHSELKEPIATAMTKAAPMSHAHR
jgi:hypothetical protein